MQAWFLLCARHYEHIQIVVPTMNLATELTANGFQFFAQLSQNNDNTDWHEKWSGFVPKLRWEEGYDCV